MLGKFAYDLSRAGPHTVRLRSRPMAFTPVGKTPAGVISVGAIRPTDRYPETGLPYFASLIALSFSNIPPKASSISQRSAA